MIYPPHIDNINDVENKKGLDNIPPEKISTQEQKPKFFVKLLSNLRQKNWLMILTLGLVVSIGSILVLFSKGISPQKNLSDVFSTSTNIITPTATNIPSPTSSNVSQSPTNKVSPTNTSSPTPISIPAIFKPGPFTYKNAEFQSRFVEVSVGPGGEVDAFTIQSKGAHEYIIKELRIFGVGGLSLSPTQGIMTNEETKQVKLRVDSSSAPGRYSGFIDMKIDGNDLVLYITVNVGSQTGERYIKVTSPKGGEAYKEGDTISIAWESKGVEIDNVSIVSENGNSLTTGRGLSANGYEWKSEKYFDKNATHFKFYINSNYVKGDSAFITIN